MKRLFGKILGIWKLIILFLLILITFSYAMFQGGFVSWFLFYSFLPFALYALIIALYPLGSFSVKRVFLKNEYNAGESLKVTLILTRKTAFPLLFIVIEDCVGSQLNFSRQRNTAKSLIFPGFQKEVVYEYEIARLPRGEHFFQAVRLKTGDPLGLIEKEKHISIQDKIIVYPSFEEMIYRPLESQYDQGMTTSKERVQRDTSMAIGIREYQPGDRFSWINWKATAKRNDIMTKEFEQRQSHDVYIIMDCTSNSRFEAVVSFAASLTRAIIRKGAQVGFLASSAERIAIPIRGGANQQQMIFYQLAKVKDDSQVPLERILKVEGISVLQSKNLMLITAELTSQLIDGVASSVANKSAVTIYLVKNEKESLSKGEIALKSAANARGLRVLLVHDGHFSTVFSGEVAK
ncbi:DUF58 domain-containing protein [Bacillus sp. Bva_UNVM-123]|uniref:DUF58 domain-containing protein n=1 Tax=Bacillus sp. Bva_UNVM-123 TaxID=2829798 RepID=UPI00391F965D